MHRWRRWASAVAAVVAAAALTFTINPPALAVTEPATPTVTVTVSGPVTSESVAPIVVTVAPPKGSSAGRVGIDVRVQVKRGAVWSTVSTQRTDVKGRVSFGLFVWKPVAVRAVTTATANLTAQTSAAAMVSVVPRAAPITSPVGATAPPGKLGRAQPAAVGVGANAKIYWVPDNVWASMRGISWIPGCLPRTSLRYLTVNFWGFDGYRYRGELIVRANLARTIADAFTQLYLQRFPIRSMVLPDRWGHAPGGFPGANDYATMAADNTSAFNCRYADGAESSGRWSTHANGGSIDINPWENPDGEGRPDSWYLVHHTVADRAILREGSAAVRAFTTRGFVWGGQWNSVDYQHFQA